MKVAILITMLPKEMREVTINKGCDGKEMKYEDLRDFVLNVANQRIAEFTPSPKGTYGLEGHIPFEATHTSENAENSEWLYWPEETYTTWVQAIKGGGKGGIKGNHEREVGGDAETMPKYTMSILYQI